MLFKNHMYLVDTSNKERRRFMAIESFRYAGMSYEGILMNIDGRGNVCDFLGRCLFKLSSILDITSTENGYIVITNNNKYVFGL